jgi:hypothetical protein
MMVVFCEIRPESGLFSPTAHVTWQFTPFEVAGIFPATLAVYMPAGEGDWIPVAGAVINSVQGTATFDAPSGGTYAIGGVVDNDDCSNPISLVPGTSITGNSTAATGSSQSGCAFGDTADVWYLLNTTSAGDYQIDTFRSQFDTTLAVYAACGGPALACNDDSGGLQSMVSPALAASSMYWVRVAGYFGSRGAFVLNVSDPVLPTGACCCGASCGITAQANCTGANRLWAGPNSACTPFSFTAPCCRGNFNKQGAFPSVQDLFDFLASYFSGDPCADANDSGIVSVQDIFDFLAEYFGGC